MTPPAPKILIVDDDTGITESLSDVLEMEGYRVEVARNGAEGVERWREGSYDCVLMDIRMPKMDGVEALRRIRQMDPRSVVIMITAFTRDKRVDRAREEGALEVLFKPIDLDRLLAFLAALSVEPTVLIVDDDRDFGESLRDALEAHGYRVTYTEEGNRAAKLAAEKPYEAVLLDMRLDGLDGLDVLQALLEAKIKTEVVLITAYAGEFRDRIDRCLSLNARTLLEKPLEIAGVLTELDEVHRSRLLAAGAAAAGG